MYKVVFPEANNPNIQAAVKVLCNECEPILLDNDLATATKLLADRQADAMIAGVDYASRDVILAVREQIGLQDGFKTFSSLFVCDFRDGRRYIIADGATCRRPNSEQLAEITLLVNDAAQKLLGEEPRLALLSFSTFGSGAGKNPDPSIAVIHDTIQISKSRNPSIIIDGEMQLDAAVNPRVANKKATTQNSPVAGRANVLITPDINSGNILYKSIEQFASAIVAGPILLGFRAAVSDLSRGSTVEDIILTTRSTLKLI